jgi:hypothetical protein
MLALHAVACGFEPPRRTLTCDATPLGPHHSLQQARALVAEHCLTGVDLDDEAVGLARELFQRFAGTVPELRAGDSLLANWGQHFNCIVMNPPYLTGGKIGSVMGSAYAQAIMELFPGCGGRCDLSAYFLRLAERVAAGVATIGCVATKTIAQGDTRLGGLDQLVGQMGCVIYRARASVPWPGDAQVDVSIVHLWRDDGSVRWELVGAPAGKSAAAPVITFAVPVDDGEPVVVSEHNGWLAADRAHREFAAAGLLSAHITRAKAVGPLLAEHIDRGHETPSEALARGVRFEWPGAMPLAKAKRGAPPAVNWTAACVAIDGAARGVGSGALEALRALKDHPESES